MKGKGVTAKISQVKKEITTNTARITHASDDKELDYLRAVIIELRKELVELRKVKTLLIEHRLKSKGLAQREGKRPAVTFEHLQGEDEDKYSKSFGGYLRCVKPIPQLKGCVTVVNDKYCLSNAHVVVQKAHDEYLEMVEEKKKNKKASTSPRVKKAKQMSIDEWTKEKEKELHGTAINVYKLNGRSRVKTIITRVNLNCDFVVLYSETGGLLDEGLAPLELAEARNGNNYIALGLPIKNNRQQIHVLKGNIADSSRKMDNKGYIFGAYGADNGFSGGPVIRLGVDNDLLGIMVGGYLMNLPEGSTDKQMRQMVVTVGSRAPLVNIIPADWFIPDVSEKMGEVV